LSIAWRLARRGLDVLVVDAGALGGEASPAGAGMLAPGGEFAGRSVWTDLGLESHALYPSFVEELSRESGRRIDFGICGAVDFEAPPERVQVQAANGIESSPVPGGVYYPNDGYVDPRDVLAALRCACQRLGVKVERRVMQAIDSSDYDALVIAAGAWSGAIAVRFRGRSLALPKTEPIKGHLIGYRLAPGTLGPIRRRGHTYLLQRANGFTIAGSNEERRGFDTGIDALVCAGIHQRAVELWPALEAHKPEECWIGFRPAAEDMLPHIGRFEDTNVWLAYGHYRNGILLAPVTAARIASTVISSLEMD
jgi:glycine oxidase